MAFWKQSDDPWDKPPKRPAPPPPQERDTEPQEGLLDSVRGWAAQKRAAQVERLTLPAETCPWCGRKMEQGFLSGGRGIFWVRGVPDTKTKWLGAGRGNTLWVNNDGGLYTYKTTWYCPVCEKMVFDAANLEPAGGEAQTAGSPYTGVFGETPAEDGQP